MCKHIDNYIKPHKLLGIHPFDEDHGIYKCGSCNELVEYLGSFATIVSKEVKQSFVATSD